MPDDWCTSIDQRKRPKLFHQCWKIKVFFSSQRASRTKLWFLLSRNHFLLHTDVPSFFSQKVTLSLISQLIVAVYISGCEQGPVENGDSYPFCWAPWNLEQRKQTEDHLVLGKFQNWQPKHPHFYMKLRCQLQRSRKMWVLKHEKIVKSRVVVSTVLVPEFCGCPQNCPFFFGSDQNVTIAVNPSPLLREERPSDSSFPPANLKFKPK